MTRTQVFLLLVLAFAAGCSEGASQEPASHHGGPTASLPGERVNKMAALPPMDQASEETPCASTEAVLFSCQTTAGKHVALCASRGVGVGQGYLYYTYGPPDRPEFVFPEKRQPPVDFRRTQLTFAGSTGGYAYSFANRDYRYIVYAISGADGLEEQGVLVTRGNSRNVVSAWSCRKGSLVEDEDAALLDLTFTWPSDPDLEQHGLPNRK